MIDNQATLNRAILLKQKLDTWRKHWNQSAAQFSMQTAKPPVLVILEKQWEKLDPNLKEAVENQIPTPTPPLGETA